MKYLIIRADAERSFASTTTGTQTGSCFLALLQRWQMRAPSAMHGYLDGESFPPASDLFPIVGNMVVGGDGEVKLRPGASALPVWTTCWGRGHGMGLWLTNLVVPGGVSKQTSTQPTRSGILIRIQKHQG